MDDLIGVYRFGLRLKYSPEKNTIQRLSEKHIFRGILNSVKITAYRSTTICLMKMLRNVRFHYFSDNLYPIGIFKK